MKGRVTAENFNFQFDRQSAMVLTGFIGTKWWASQGELMYDLCTYAAICVNVNFLSAFSSSLLQENECITILLRCTGLIYVLSEGGGQMEEVAKIYIQGPIKIVTWREIGHDSIVSAMAAAMNRAWFHQQTESGMGKRTIKSALHTAKLFQSMHSLMETGWN